MAAKKTADLKQPVKISRSETNRMLGGVAAGLGDYFNIDANIVRLFFILLTIFGGSGVVLYFILWILLPNRSKVALSSDQNIKINTEEMQEKAKSLAESFKSDSGNNSRGWFGWLIVFLGVILLLSNLGLINPFYMRQLWPVVLIVFGLLVLSRNG